MNSALAPARRRQRQNSGLGQPLPAACCVEVRRFGLAACGFALAGAFAVTASVGFAATVAAGLAAGFAAACVSGAEAVGIGGAGGGDAGSGLVAVLGFAAAFGADGA